MDELSDFDLTADFSELEAELEQMADALNDNEFDKWLNDPEIDAEFAAITDNPEIDAEFEALNAEIGDLFDDEEIDREFKDLNDYFSGEHDTGDLIKPEICNDVYKSRAYQSWKEGKK